jgi:hypothetical protein
MNGFDSLNLPLAVGAYLGGAIGAVAFGDASIVVNVLAGAGLGALVAQLVILFRARQGVHGREPQIVAAWSAFVAGLTLIVTVLVELL